MQDDLIGTVESCEILRIDRSTLSRWVNAREPKLTPALQLSGDGRMLFLPSR
jgi:predicted site-specific integrase-resolvase